MEIAKLFASLGLRPDQKSFEKGNKLIGGVKKALAAFAGFEIVRGVASAVNATVELGGHLDDLRQKTGLTAEALQEWGAIAAQGGSSMDGFADGVKHFSRTLAEAKAGSSTAKDALTKLGLSSADVNVAMSGSAGLDATLMKVSDTIAKMPDGPTKTAAAMAALGRSGDALIPAFNGGSAAIAKMRADLKDFELTGAQVSALDDLGDTADRAKGQLIGLKNQAIAQLAPVLKDMVVSLMAWVKANRALIQSALTTVVKGLAIAAEGAAIAIKAVVAVIDFFREHGDLARAVIIAIGVAFGVLAVQAAAAWIVAAAPVILFVAAIAGLILIVQDLWNSFMHGKGVLASVWRWIKEKLSAAGHAILDAFGSVWSAIKRGFSAAFNFIADLPVIKQLLWMIKKLDGLAGLASRGFEGVKEVARSLPGLGGVRKASDNPLWQAVNRGVAAPVMSGTVAARAGASPGAASKSTQVNAPVTINVTSTAPAAEVAKIVDNRIGQHIRTAFAGAGGDQ